MLTTSLVGQHPPRDPQQPRQRLHRNLINPSPCDQEHFSDHVIRGVLSRAATRIREHPSGMLLVQLLKPHSRHLASQCPARPLRITPAVAPRLISARSSRRRFGLTPTLCTDARRARKNVKAGLAARRSRALLFATSATGREGRRSLWAGALPAARCGHLDGLQGSTAARAKREPGPVGVASNPEGSRGVGAI